jgi:hypothetical protein
MTTDAAFGATNSHLHWVESKEIGTWPTAGGLSTGDA